MQEKGTIELEKMYALLNEKEVEINVLKAQLLQTTQAPSTGSCASTNLKDKNNQLAAENASSKRRLMR